jgi:hypothetical protein
MKIKTDGVGPREPENNTLHGRPSSTECAFWWLRSLEIDVVNSSRGRLKHQRAFIGQGWDISWMIMYTIS